MGFLSSLTGGGAGAGAGGGGGGQSSSATAVTTATSGSIGNRMAATNNTPMFIALAVAAAAIIGVMLYLRK